MSNAINWFEIPTRDMDKAIRFYEAMLGVSLQRETFGGVPHGVFPADKGDQKSVHGALVTETPTKRGPGAGGVVIYLNAPNGVPDAVEKATKAGGAVLLPTTAIGPHGWIAVVRDLDGNEVGLHAPAK